MKLAKRFLWLERSETEVVLGSGLAFAAAHLRSAEDVSEARAVLWDSASPEKLTSRLKSILQGVRVVIGDGDWDPNSPLEVERPPAFNCVHVHVPAQAARRTATLSRILASAVSSVASGGLLRCVITSGSDLARDQHQVESICRQLQRHANARPQPVVLEFWVRTSSQAPAATVLPWAEKLGIGLQIRVRLPERSGTSAASTYDQLERDVREYVSAHVPVCVEARIDARNIDQMVPFAQYCAELTNGRGSLQLPAVRPLARGGAPLPAERLPQPEVYAQNLLAIYRLNVVPDDGLAPVAELRHRVSRGMDLPQCGCVQGNVVVVDAAGHTYACEGMYDAVKQGRLRPSAPDRFCVPSACEGCQWQFFCGLPCLAMSRWRSEGLPSYAATYAHDIFCIPRRTLLEALVWDIVKENEERTLVSTGT